MSKVSGLFKLCILLELDQGYSRILYGYPMDWNRLIDTPILFDNADYTNAIGQINLENDVLRSSL